MADTMDEDRVKVIVQEVMNGKVVYRDTCEKQHEGDNREMKEVKDKLKLLDGRMWGILITGLFQLIGIVVLLIKGVK